MSKDRENIPRANMLMGSMRSMGYSFESAVADIIDNSISANCKMSSYTSHLEVTTLLQSVFG